MQGLGGNRNCVSRSVRVPFHLSETPLRTQALGLQQHCQAFKGKAPKVPKILMQHKAVEPSVHGGKEARFQLGGLLSQGKNGITSLPSFMTCYCWS